ncbi:MAG: hypothetical protein JXA94_03820 [Parachlamydiales bacterium]|nr:hypothetical protein [Parachlamydiales bacterium]
MLEGIRNYGLSAINYFKSAAPVKDDASAPVIDNSTTAKIDEKATQTIASSIKNYASSIRSSAKSYASSALDKSKVLLDKLLNLFGVATNHVKAHPMAYAGAAGTVLTAGAIYGIYKLTPRVKAWVKDYLERREVRNNWFVVDISGNTKKL